MIKNIVFDFGDVLVRDRVKILEKKYHFNKLSQTEKNKYIKAFHDSETGIITNQELLKAMHETLAKKISPQDIKKFIFNTYTLPPWKLAKKLKVNYKIIIFSNNLKGWPQRISKLLKINFLIFPWVNSSYQGMRKPNILFYKYLIKKFHLKPKETIFIDDKKINLIPARRLGINTFQYVNNITQLKKFLKKLSVKI